MELILGATDMLRGSSTTGKLPFLYRVLGACRRTTNQQRASQNSRRHAYPPTTRKNSDWLVNLYPGHTRRS